MAGPSPAGYIGRASAPGAPPMRPLVLVALALAAGLAPAADPVKHRIMFAEYGKGPEPAGRTGRRGEGDLGAQVPRASRSSSRCCPTATSSTPTAASRPACARSTATRRWSGSTRASARRCSGASGCRTATRWWPSRGRARRWRSTRTGRWSRTTPLTTTEKGYHLQVRNVHKLANGNILAAHEGEGAVREVDPDGKVVWEYTKVENAGEALRLANGNTLIAVRRPRSG